MPDGSRAVAALGWILAALSLTAFAYLAISGRVRGGETPQWSAARFVRLAGDGAPADSTWMVAVNPGCLHCRASLPVIAAEAHALSPPPAFAVLLVDAPARMNPDSLAALPAQAVWWDSAGVWRRAWHHTMYGEVLVFDRGGRLIRTRSAAGAP